ncbi:MAG: GNAT family N-acetyltransferase [Anaerolineaceae bacterium]|nr:GNAT family N-acetyltransferase [Anaerolineaceae bacterium]
MQIQPVVSRSDLKEFIELPYRHYRTDPLWVPPLKSEQKDQYDVRQNPMLEHCEYALFLVKDGGEVIGRVSAFIDRLALKHWQQPIGLFGSYECVQDAGASHLLLETAQDWLKKHGLKVMRGPWSFASQEWGLVQDGFSPAPVILAPYNPPWYNDQFLSFGLQKAKDLLVYYIDAREGYEIDDRYLTLTELVKKRYHIHTRPVDMKNIERDVVTIVELANQSLSNNWGFYPVTENEGRAMARDLKQIVNPKAIVIAEDENNRPIGFGMSLPDINILLKSMHGSLLPFGWLKMLIGLPKLKQYRMWALGVIPEYQGRAIDTLLYQATYEALYSKDIRLEINYVLEDDDRMNNALSKLGAKPLRRYRVYQKDI